MTFSSFSASLSPSAPLLAQLNPEQLAAVTLPTGHALILAGAGSGKTRVLTTRIAWLLQQGLATPGGVLAVTFTNKAAKEMVTRLSALVPVNVRGMWIGTFHGLCNRMLRAHYKLVGLPQTFQILDMQDQLSAIKRLCKQHDVPEQRLAPKQLAQFINQCKEEGLRPHTLNVAQGNPLALLQAQLYQLYEDQCQREGVVDFAELLLRSFELLRDNPAVRGHYQQRFRHILVDEFQDTNALQYAWLKQLAGDVEPGGALRTQGSVLAVGDDDQSIYAFRGARVGNMQDFVREFAVEQVVKLEQNYRSYSNILDCANALIAHNSERLGKNLRTAQGPGEPVRVYEASSDFAEAQWLTEEISQLVRTGVLVPSQVAVLYRSNAQSRVLESALFNAGIAYRVYGGLRFFERAEIKHALAYLRLLENPQDDTSFLRVVNFPARGIGARTLEQLQDAARSSGESLHQAVAAVPGKGGDKLAQFVALLTGLRQATQGCTLRETMEQMLEHSGLVAHYAKEKEGQDRIENLQELSNAAESFVTQEGFGHDALALPLDEQAASQPNASAPSLVDTETGETVSPLVAFLTHAALEAGDNQAQVGQEAVQLMTVHASKGLEFDGVFITGMEEGLCPHENASFDRQGLEEERRLMYVAITRARKRLYLSHTQTRMLHGKTRFNLPSRFYDELPPGALKWLTSTRRQGAAGGGGVEAARAPAFSAQPAWGGQTRSAGVSVKAVPDLPRQATSGQVFAVGSGVFHNKFGEGKVLAYEGKGEDARVQVHFPRHGTKWLVLAMAKLTALP